MITALLRYYSYLFHVLLAFAMLGVSVIALGTNPDALRLEALPWTGSTLTYALIGLAFIGLVSVALAWLKNSAWLLLLWSVAVPLWLTYKFVFTRYGFDPGQLSIAVCLVVAALAAIPGPALQALGKKR